MPKQDKSIQLKREEAKVLLGVPEGARLARHTCGEEFTCTVSYPERLQFDEHASALVESFKRRAFAGGYRLLHPRFNRAVRRRERFEQSIHFRLLRTGGPLMAVVLGVAENRNAAAAHPADFKTATAVLIATSYSVRTSFNLRKEPTSAAAGLGALTDVLLRYTVSDNVVVVCDDPLASLIESGRGAAGEVIKRFSEFSVSALRPSAIPGQAARLTEAHEACQRVASIAAHALLITTPATTLLSGAMKMIGPHGSSLLDELEGRRGQGASASTN